MSPVDAPSDAVDAAMKDLDTWSSKVQAKGTEARVCEDIAFRQHVGLKKYGVQVENNPLSLIEWLQHAYEETLDQAIYLRRSIEELRKSQLTEEVPPVEPNSSAPPEQEKAPTKEGSSAH